MKKTVLCFTIVLISIMFSKMKAQESDRIVGVWLNYNKDAHIEVFKKDNKYYGKIIWMKNPNNADGTPKLDTENPEEKLRSRKRLGLEIMKGLKYDDDEKEWEGGTIYDPQSGSTYKVYLWFEDNDYTKLNMRGYIGFSLIGKTTQWFRVEKK